jgi:hypothetical protein
VRSVVQLYPGPFFAAERPKIERSEAERRKETKSVGGLDGEYAAGPRSSVSSLLSPFCPPTLGWRAGVACEHGVRVGVSPFSFPSYDARLTP